MSDTEGAAPERAPAPDPREPTPVERDAAAGGNPVVRALLRVPLYYKILIANAALVLLGAIVGGTVTAHYVRAEPGRSPAGLVWLMAVGGVLLSLLVNAFILRLALSPLQDLEQTAARVQDGDLDARVPRSPLADRELDRLSRTFNGMLDAAAAYRTRLREVAVRALGAAEEERKRVARELHDETAQMLAALLIRIRVLKSARDPDAAAGMLEEMRREVGVALEGVRRFARGLRPPSLDELGLVPAIESHARALSEITQLLIQVDAAPLEPGVLTPEAELAVYRIVQEALSNVVRHAHATRVALHVGRHGDALRVEVSDDGHGFSPSEVMASGGGLGLFGMKERAAYLGGNVEVESQPGAGTRVRAEIPLSGMVG